MDGFRYLKFTLLLLFVFLFSACNILIVIYEKRAFIHKFKNVKPYLLPHTKFIKHSHDLKRIGFYKWRFPVKIQPRNGNCLSVLQEKMSFIDLVLLVNTKHANQPQRQLIRKMYNTSPSIEGRLKVIFTLGNDPDGNITREKLLEEESHMYGDVLQVNLNGTYFNLSGLLYNGLQWSLKNCPNLKFIGKISDDVILNIPALMRLLDAKGESELQHVVFGGCKPYTRPIRNISDIFYIDTKTYPFDKYPPYCSGAFSFMSLQTAKDILRETENIGFPTPFDDVNVGINMVLSGHVTCNIPGFYTTMSKKAHMKHEYRRKSDCSRFQMSFLGIHLHGSNVEHLTRFEGYRYCFKPMNETIENLKCNVSLSVFALTEESRAKR